MNRAAVLREVLSDLGAFSRALYPDRALRRYQVEAAGPIVEAVDAGRGGAFSILFSRQAGKDELLAQLQAFLLCRYRIKGGQIVVGAPTFKPQCLVSRRRLLDRVATPLHPGAHPTEGYRVVVGKAGVSFLSTEPSANVRGETADRLLIANEAQDITTDRWDAVFAPMTASTNAPSVFSGTPWVAGSLLSRQRAITRDLGTLYEADWQRVAEEVPAYGEHVKDRIAQLGAEHPFIKSEYCLVELGDEGGLFPERRRAQMRGEHPRRHEAEPGRRYALLVDVAGEDEDNPEDPAERARARKRDSTALTVVEVEAGRGPLPVYRVVDRREWVGVKHTALHATLLDLARNVWKAKWLVIDATGIGAGLASFLAAALRAPAGAGTRRCTVIPYVFGLKSKSDLGWGFLGCVESGRYKEYADDQAPDTRTFWGQVAACKFMVDVGPGRIMRWSVPESMGHDDLLISAALCAALDEQEIHAGGFSARVREDFV